MPEGNRYALKDKFRHKDKVLEILEKNKIKVIDIDKNIFTFLIFKNTYIKNL
tara:strand:- start:236 stop:391 length:156 start_codon:yes stop_codon:yes gene_type:complete